VALAVRDDATNYWSKALGFTEPVTAELVASVTDFYRANRNPLAVLQFAPSTLPADWDEICAKEGLTAGSTWLKLSGPPVAALGESGLRIQEVTDAELWATTLVRGFGMPEDFIVPMSKGVVGRPGWTTYGAFDGDQMVAAAGLRIDGEVAAFAGASTLPEHRGKGAQSALLAARISKAAAEGVKLLSAETGKPDEGEKNSSLNNMLRAGFTISYERQNWIWRSDPLGE
jgi:GNAT superfamily N-acetyltransferase